MSVTRAWKVYGQSGHRQGASFTPSVSWDFSNEIEGTAAEKWMELDSMPRTGKSRQTW